MTDKENIEKELNKYGMSLNIKDNYKNKIKKWIEKTRKAIENPDDLSEEELEGVYYDEGEQAQLQLLDELEGII